MLNQADRQTVADRLLQAHRERTPIPSPKQTFPALEIEDAYRIQQLCVD